MAIKKCSPLLTNNPLCAIATYKDTINLETGVTTRYIGKVVLTGESVVKKKSGNAPFQVNCPHGIKPPTTDVYWLCSHYPSVSNDETWTRYDYLISFSVGDMGETENDYFRIRDTDRASYTAAQYSDYLAQQYANGTPVTIWYVLATPTTETVTVPTGSHGTVEGFLTRSSEPTPSNPVYPTANPVLAWNTISYRKYGTEADILTSFPADVIADGQSASANIKGAMNQASTPSPSSSIYPSECGNKTANLFDKNANIIWHNNAILNDSGNETSSNSSGYTNPFIEVESNTTYTLNGDLSQYSTGTAGGYRVYYYQDSTFISRSSIMNNSNKTFTTPQNCNRIALQCQIINDYPHLDTVMLNTGSTALPYQPYGYKIPISSGGTTTNVYLGEVQSTRRIKKLVLTGNESGTVTVDNTNHIFALKGIFNSEPELLQVGGVCTHYKYNNAVSSLVANMQDGDFVLNKIIDDYSFTIKDNSLNTSNDFITYLSQQYANGTPVCVWYVLATPQTTTLNKPIRKIGDYADSISVSNLPTTGTAEQFDVDTTLKPSEVDLTYHGWHEHQPKKYVGGVVNKFNKDATPSSIYVTATATRLGVEIPVTTGTYNVSGGTSSFFVKTKINDAYGTTAATQNPITLQFNNDGMILLYSDTENNYNNSKGGVMLVDGSTVPSEYHPYYEWIED